jgi:hypothetical protein
MLAELQTRNWQLFWCLNNVASNVIRFHGAFAIEIGNLSKAVSWSISGNGRLIIVNISKEAGFQKVTLTGTTALSGKWINKESYDYVRYLAW